MASCQTLFLVFILVVSPLVLSEVSAACNVSASLQSKSLRIATDGRKALFSPIQNGAIFPDFFNLSLRITSLAERFRRPSEDPSIEPDCIWSANMSGDIIQTFDIDQFDCALSEGSYIRSSDDIQVQWFNITYTNPAIPGFSIANSFYVTNGTFEERPEANNTYVDPGRELVWRYEQDSIKWAYNITGVPWLGYGGTPDAPNPNASYLHIFLEWGLQVSHINVTVFDNHYDGGFIFTQLNGPNTMSNTFDKAFLYDNMGFFKRENKPDTRNTTTIPLATGDYFQPLISGVPFCTPFHYQTVIYDPTLTVLFPSSPNPSSSSTSSGKGWKIAVGVSLGLVALLVIFFVALTIFYEPFRLFIRPYSSRSKASTAHQSLDDITPKAQHATAASTHTSSPSSLSSTAASSGWNAAQKPPVS